MLAGKNIRVILVGIAVLGIGLAIGLNGGTGIKNTIQVADRYHARNRTTNFFERSATSRAKVIVVGNTAETKPVNVGVRTIRRR